MKRIMLLASVVLALLGGAYAHLPHERTYLFRYSFRVKRIPQDTREIRIWVPYPAENPYQDVLDISAQKATSAGFDSDYLNRMRYYSIKSPGVSELTFECVYRINRREFVNTFRLIPSQGNGPRAKERVVEKYAAFDGFVSVNDEVHRLARQITAEKKTDIEKARAMYDYLFAHMTYDKTEPGWGQGDVERVCRLWKGNCTDFHSLFIALCRASGIPAKFVIGVPISKKDRGKPAGYHCWAEFYSKGRGWVPVDIAQAWKEKSKYEYYFGAVDADRIELSHGRGIRLDPSQKGGPLNYFVYPYVEIDGKKFDNVQTSFYYESIT